jgi:cell wall-associated NlpC family hydrolase
MHQQRLVGGLAALAVLLLLTLSLTSSSALASPARRAAAGVRAGGPFGVTVAADTAAAPSQPLVLGDVPTAAPPVIAVADAARARRMRARHSAPARLVVFARRQLGVPYAYGGASRSGFDCSGLTMYVYRHLGISLPHGATAQAGLGHAVSLRHLQPGDLVFWGGGGYYSHVALYAGHGRIIAAPHSGTVVQYQQLSGASAARRLLPAR